MKKRAFSFSYMIAIVVLLVAASFIISCDGCDGGDDTTGAPSATTTATVNASATTAATTSATTSATTVATTAKPNSGDGWITDKNGDPAYY